MSNIHINNSAFVSKRDFDSVLDQYHNEVTENRSRFSLKMEWATHNFLYKLNICRDRTKDVDLNYPQKWYITTLYVVGGMVSWIFIK